MKAWRNIGGTVVEIDVDVDPENNPILPPDTTTDIRPEVLEGHYVTVVDKVWVQIPIPVPFITFETKRNVALDRVKEYRDWYLNTPVTVGSAEFDGDERARNRLVQALVIFNETGYLPPAWIMTNNQPHPIATINDLKTIIAAVQTAFSTRFFETAAIREAILAATNEAALEAITIPVRPNRF